MGGDLAILSCLIREAPLSSGKVTFEQIREGGQRGNELCGYVKAEHTRPALGVGSSQRWLLTFKLIEYN